MAYYIDFSAAGGGDGSPETPYNDFPTIASDNEYYIKRGTSINRTSALYLTGLSNVVIGAYYMDGATPRTDGNTVLPLPVLSSYFSVSSSGIFTEVPGDADVWRYNSGEAFWDPHTLLGMGGLGDRHYQSWDHRANYKGGNPNEASGTAAFTAYRQWDYNNGSATADDEASLYIYAPQDPFDEYGEIFFGRGQRAVITPRQGCSNILIQDLHFKWAYSGVSTNPNTGYTNTDVTVRRCVVEHCYFGIACTSSGGSVQQSTRILNNKVYVSGCVGIRPNLEMPGSRIAGNYVKDTGGCEPIGGIYGAIQGTKEDPVIVEGNIVDTVYGHDFYWGYEFNGIYQERLGHDSIWRNNLVMNIDFGHAIHNNSGSYRNKFHNNVIVGALRGIGDSDSLQNDQGYETEYTNNLLTEVKFGVSVTRHTAGDHNKSTFRNNIFTANGDTGSIGFLIAPDADDSESSAFEDFNTFYQFDTVKQRGDGASGPLVQTLGLNDQVADPMLGDRYNLLPGSPCIGTGAGPVSERDFNGAFRDTVECDRGAVWFTSVADSTDEEVSLASGG